LSDQAYGLSFQKQFSLQVNPSGRQKRRKKEEKAAGWNFRFRLRDTVPEPIEGQFTGSKIGAFSTFAFCLLFAS
jgi:hypothetical protein